MVEEDKQATQRQLLHHLPQADGMPAALQVTILEKEKSLVLVFVFFIARHDVSRDGTPILLTQACCPR